MKIDRNRLKMGIWYEDSEGNFIPGGDAVDPPAAAATRHVCFPLEIREEIYGCNDGKADNKPMATFGTHIGGDGREILQMANSGDFTLKEAIAVYAHACERCANALIWKYSGGQDGYPEYSEEWKKANTVCDYCRDMEA